MRNRITIGEPPSIYLRIASTLRSQSSFMKQACPNVVDRPNQTSLAEHVRDRSISRMIGRAATGKYQRQ